MKNQVIPFTFDSTEIRVLEEGGVPLFVASDVAKVLGYRMSSDMTRRLDGDEKGTRSVRTLGGTQEMTVITESGLYNAILGSKVEGARRFKRWVTHEVLPAIRRHGVYATQQAAEEFIKNPDALLYTLKALQEEREKTAQLEAQAALDAPKVLFADSVAASKTSILVGQLAKILTQNGYEIGQNRLFAWMRENGYLSKRRGNDWNMPKQDYVEMGLFEIKESSRSQPDGTVRITKTTKVTGKGQQYFLNKLLVGSTTTPLQVVGGVAE